MIAGTFLGNNNKNDESIFLFDKSMFLFLDQNVFFPGKKLAVYSSPYFLFFSSLPSNLFTLYIEKNVATYNIPSYLALFSDETSSLATVLMILSHCVLINFFF